MRACIIAAVAWEAPVAMARGRLSAEGIRDKTVCVCTLCRCPDFSANRGGSTKARCSERARVLRRATRDVFLAE